MICTNCSTENPAGNRFCGNCGQPLAAPCPNCNADNPPGQKFCGQCGHVLIGADLDPAPTTERRLVTVLFADLTGYTSFAEARDSEDTREFLGKYFEKSREAIERFGGKVEKFIGDAVMAVWGADIAHEDDAERAVRAGFELTDLVAQLAEMEGAVDLALRVGINTGEAAVGSGEDHMGFVTGDLVNTASRLETAATPGTVLVGEATMSAAARAIAFVSAGERSLKGKALPVPAWRALHVLSEVGGKGRAESLEPPFVGRAEELRLLKDLLEKVGRESRSRTISLVGEAGIGKSRLVWELLKYIDGLVENVYWHEGRSPSYGDGVTFWAIGDMVRRRAGILETDPDGIVLSKLDEALNTYVKDLADRAWMKPRVAAVLGVGETPPGDRAELEAAIRAFFEGVASQGTTVLVFEDLHWSDEALLDFVDDLSDWWRDQPILVITLARPDLLERRPNWGTGRPGVISLTLGILSDLEMTQLVDRTVPGLPENTTRSIVKRAAGVPLYAVELLRSLLASGEIEAVNGGYRVSGEIGELAVPESLQAVIGARLDRLDPDDRALIQDAAVLGHTFSLPALSVISGRSVEQLETQVSQLSRRELVEPVRDLLSPERGQYRFLQGLIRDVALGRMSRENRRKRHLAVAEHMEMQADPEIAVVIASHYLQALEATPEGDEHDRIKEKALASVLGAAERAANLHAAEQVISISEKGIELAENDAERARFWEHMLEACVTVGQREIGEKYGHMALEYHQSAGNEVDSWRLLRKLGFAYVQTGQRIKAIELLKDLVESREALDVHPEIAKSAIVYCRALMLQSMPVGSTLDAAIAAAEKLDLAAYVIDGIITKAGYSDVEGRLTEAQFLLRGAIDLADKLDLAQEATRARNNLAFQLSGMDLSSTKTIGEEALELARRSGNRSMIQWFLGQQAMQKGLFGLPEELADIVTDPMWEAAGDDVLSALRYGEFLVALWTGAHAEARSLLQESMDLSDPRDPQARGWGFAGEATIDLFEGDLERAIGLLDEMDPDDWWTASASWWVSTVAAVLADDETLLKTISVFARYHPRFSTTTSFLRALSIADDEPENAIEVVDAALAESERDGDRTFRLAYLIGAAKKLSSDHPKRQEYLERARELSSQNGLNGFVELIDRFVPA